MADNLPRLCRNVQCFEVLAKAWTHPLCPSCRAAYRMGLQRGGWLAAACGLLVGAIAWWVG